MDIKEAVEELKKGRVEYRSDKTGIVHLSVGKVSMDEQQVIENVEAVMSEVNKKKPADTKGDFVQSVTVSSTMGPGSRLLPVFKRA